MGCCIIGAIVFGFIFSLWRRIGPWLGFAADEDKPNPAMWRYGENGDSSGSPALGQAQVKRPLLAPRFAAALIGGVLTIAAGFMVVDHAAHIKQEIACGLSKTGLASSADACNSGAEAHQVGAPSHHH